MITLQEAQKQQDELQASGQRLLAHFQINEKLALLGDVHLDGSMSYGLLVKPDIDFHIFNDRPDIKKVAVAVQELMEIPELVRVHVSNKQEYEKPGPGKPIGIYLGFQIYFEGNIWNFDVWVLRMEDRVDPTNFPKGWDQKLTKKQRDNILLIKHQLKDLGLYPGIGGDKFASADVYRAVMVDGVETVDGMRQWRKNHPYY